MISCVHKMYAGLISLLLCAVLAQSAAGAMSPGELREQANGKLSRGEFMDAIPDLMQLVEWLGESDRGDIKASMEMVYFNLGICQFFVGQFKEAQDVFETYQEKYRHGFRVRHAALYSADAKRFEGKPAEAVAAYEKILRQFRYEPDLKADIYAGMARCHLAEGEWGKAIPALEEMYWIAPDALRQSWAATLLTTAYFKDLQLEKIYTVVPYLLQPNSFASRSVAFNMAALEAGDNLFADENYREALWVYRMVFPHDLVSIRGMEYLEELEAKAEWTRKNARDPRELMRLQESIGELESEIEALEQIENYDMELYFRIARGYMEFMRYREAREIFHYLHEVADDAQAEEALFLAFQCSSQVVPWDRAFEIGRQYMDTYPGGEFYDMVTLASGQMRVRRQDWIAAIDLLTEALQVSPEHESAAECMLLLGYSSFMEERFSDAVEWLTRMNTKFPGSELRDESTYWLGMAYMFDGLYAEASREFDVVLEAFPDCMYVEDAAFRRAACDYGLGRFEMSDRRLEGFVAAYPESRLAGEALMMRGDIAGALGRAGAAVKFYKQAMRFEELNIEFYNHCAFQAGRILRDEEEYEALRAHYLRYIEEAREGCNIPQAVYWVGVALWNSGEQAGALHYYRETVEKYGADPGAIGVDMILDEWIARARQGSEEQAESAWADIRDALKRAHREKRPTLVLRLQRVLLFAPALSSSEKKVVETNFSNEDVMAYASPAVMQIMLTMAQERDDKAFADKVALDIIRRFTETDYALDARMYLARSNMASAEKIRSKAEARQNFDAAKRHLGVIIEVFASSTEAAEALMLMGKIYRATGEYGKADAAYEQVLGVRGWRTFWPEALLGRGECAFEQRDYQVASAYYERIYLMYSHYRNWTAQAYVKRAECLQRMFQPVKAREVLEEMLSYKDLAESREGQAARELLRKIGASS